MLPTIGGGDNRKLDGNSSFLSRMLGRSPSKGSLPPQPGQIQPTSGPSGPLKGSAGVLDRTAPQAPQGSLKTAINSSGNSGGWSIGSNKQEQGLSSSIGRVPSAKNLQDAASRSANNPLASSINSNNNNSAGGLVQRIPSAQRLSPIGGRTASPSSDANMGSSSQHKLQGSPDPGEVDVTSLSTDELKQMAMALRKEKAALQSHIEAISGSGKPGSGSGVPSSTAAATHSSASPRTSAVTFGPTTTTHRSSTLVVEFAEPRHQQRPSMIAHTVEQIRAGLAPAVSSRPRESTVAPEFGSDLMEAEDEISFDEDNSSTARPHAGKSYAGPPKGSASLETGPSLDPLQATRASAEAAEVKRQLMMSQSVKAAAEAEAKRAAEAKKAAEAAAAAQAAAAAAPAKPVSKRRYKLLSVYALLPPSMRREEWSLSQFAVEKRLHKGYASEVYKARDTQSGEMMAVKVYNLSALGELNKVQLIREIRLHGSMAHRNIIELYVAFQEESRVILAQKYAEGGDLLKALHHAGGRLTEHSAVSMVIQPLLSCMVYLHGKGIIHRDIKPENILFDESILKVADFGLALNTNEEHAVTRAGTLHYMAPEVVKNPLKDHPDDFKNENRYHYNMVVDSWAVGCLAYELLVGYPPFTANTQQQVVQNINNMQVSFPKRVSEEAIDFIKGALERVPADRATTMELIKHPWIQQHMRRGSSRHLSLQPHVAVAKTTTDFASGTATAKKMDTARRAADHGPKEAIMAPF